MAGVFTGPPFGFDPEQRSRTGRLSVNGNIHTSPPVTIKRRDLIWLLSALNKKRAIREP